MVSVEASASGSVPCDHASVVHPAPVGVPMMGGAGSEIVMKALKISASACVRIEPLPQVWTSLSVQYRPMMIELAEMPVRSR